MSRSLHQPLTVRVSEGEVVLVARPETPAKVTLGKMDAVGILGLWLVKLLCFSGPASAQLPSR